MSTNKCPGCGLVNFRSEPQCMRCGSPLPVGASRTPFFGCTFCGSQLSVTDQSCPSCQAPVRAVAEEPRPAEHAAAERTRQQPQRNLSPCPDCGHMVSTAAASCPSCGRPFTQPAPQQYAQPAVRQAPFQYAQPVPFAQPMQYAQPVQVQYAQPVQYVQPLVVAPVFQQAPAAPPKSRVLYVVLALFLGGLGVHNFYAGYNGRGAAQLVISLVTGFAGGFFLVAIWSFVECFVVNTDAHGRRMT